MIDFTKANSPHPLYINLKDYQETYRFFLKKIDAARERRRRAKDMRSLSKAENDISKYHRLISDNFGCDHYLFVDANVYVFPGRNGFRCPICQKRWPIRRGAPVLDTHQNCLDYPLYIDRGCHCDAFVIHSGERYNLGYHLGE